MCQLPNSKDTEKLAMRNPQKNLRFLFNNLPQDFSPKVYWQRYLEGKTPGQQNIQWQQRRIFCRHGTPRFKNQPVSSFWNLADSIEKQHPKRKFALF
jgi:hypothetical protein